MTKEGFSENSKSPELEQKDPPKKVLKISEMALSVDGDYLGEIGNPSYRNKPNMFEYDPEVGLLVNGQKRSELLAIDDLVRIPHAFGSISFERLLGQKKQTLSGTEFESQLYHLFENIRKKIDKITQIAKLLNIDWQDHNTDWCINNLARQNPQFTPEELLDKILTELEDRLNWQKSKESEGVKKFDVARIKNTGVLDIDPQKNRDGIVNYFYLFCELKGIDTSNPESIFTDGFGQFIFLDELIDEYKKNPDGRFGDALLVACSQQASEWQKEEVIN